MFLKWILAYNFEYNLKENKILSIIRVTFRYLNLHTVREIYKSSDSRWKSFVLGLLIEFVGLTQDNSVIFVLLFSDKMFFFLALVKWSRALNK
jgi:hypothetical protein